MIEIYILEQLAAVAKAGTLSKAAEELHISQPSITRSMQKLEADLNVSLFDRSRNRLSLNDNGRLAAEYANRILEDERIMVQAIQSYDRSKRTISLGSVAPGPIFHYSPVISRLYPDMTISSETKDEQELIDGIAKNLYQIIFLDHPLTDDEHVCIHCLDEHLHIAVQSDHPLAGSKSITFKEMNGHSFLMYSGVGIWDSLVREKLPDSHILVQNEMNVLEELIGASTIASFVTNVTNAINNRSNSGRINIPITDPEATVNFYAVIKKENEKTYEDFLASSKLRE